MAKKTYTVEVTAKRTTRYLVHDAETEEQAKKIAQHRHKENAPIHMVAETDEVTDIAIVPDDSTD